MFKIFIQHFTVYRKFSLYFVFVLQRIRQALFNARCKEVSKKKRVEESVINAFLPISKKEVCNLLPDVSATTIEQVLGSMMKDKKIKKNGLTKSAKYIKI